MEKWYEAEKSIETSRDNVNASLFQKYDGMASGFEASERLALRIASYSKLGEKSALLGLILIRSYVISLIYLMPVRAVKTEQK